MIIDLLSNSIIKDMSKTHLQEGDPAPDFACPDQDGQVHTLAQYRGQKLVIFFYPRDNTPGCTAEACNLRDNYSALSKAGYTILGVSADSQRKHQNFIAKFDLPFPLLADTERKMITDYGVWGVKKFMGREFEGILRTTFLIDEEGTISRVISSVKTSKHASQILT